MRTFVWVDAWQQQCCGDRFEVGSTVAWKVVPQAERDEWVEQLLGTVWANKVQFHEEHHNDVHDEITGDVIAIHVITCHRTLHGHDGRQGWVPVPASGVLRSVEVADPWEPDRRLGGSGTVTFDGWIVELECASA